MLARGLSSVALSLAVCTGLCLAQEPAPAAVDRTDPQAVAQAFFAALDAPDAKAAAELLAGSEEFRQAWLMAAEMMAPELDGTFEAMMLEMTFLPIGLSAAERQLAATPKGDDMVVTATERPRRVRKLILVRDAEGRWSVDLGRSVLATTGREQSFLVDAMTGVGGEGAPEMLGMAREAAIVDAAATVLEWADGHDGLLPPADTWLDDVEAYSLEGARLKRPGAKEGECGFALNAALVGKALPKSFPERDKLILLYECADFSRNLVGDPDEELLPGMTPDGASWIATAGATPLPVLAEELPSERLQDVADWRTCRDHVRALVEALRAFARDHDGLLPQAGTWCDDIEPYLAKAGVGAEAFKCPGAPDLGYGYALNEALAGLDVRSLQGHAQYVLIVPSAKGERNEARALPQTVEAGRHPDPSFRAWLYCVCVGMLNGAAEALMEGQQYQRGGM